MEWRGGAVFCCEDRLGAGRSRGGGRAAHHPGRGGSVGQRAFAAPPRVGAALRPKARVMTCFTVWPLVSVASARTVTAPVVFDSAGIVYFPVNVPSRLAFVLTCCQVFPSS